MAGFPDFTTPATKVQSPATLAHVVLRTADLPQLQDFYVKFLGGRVVYAASNLSFITYDDEHHRIALVEMPETEAKNPKTCGLHHIAFTFNNLTDLLKAYRQRKALGINPFWSVNHGPTTSIYYKDTDDNVLETQIDNFATPDEATDFMTSEAFKANPVGTDFDPEEFIAALQRGESEATLKQRKEIGARLVPDLDTI